MVKIISKCLFVFILSVIYAGVSLPVSAQGNWVFGNPVQSTYNYNPAGQTIQYYPPELGAGTRARYKTTPYFYEVPGRIEPNVQPNPLRDEMEKQNYV